MNPHQPLNSSRASTAASSTARSSRRRAAAPSSSGCRTSAHAAGEHVRRRAPRPRAMRQLLRRLRYENDDVRPTSRRLPPRAPPSPPPFLPASHWRNAAPRPPRLLHPVPFRRVGGASTDRLTPTPSPPTPNRATAPGGALARSPSAKRRGSSSRLSLSVARRADGPPDVGRGGVRVAEQLGRDASRRGRTSSSLTRPPTTAPASAAAAPTTSRIRATSAPARTTRCADDEAPAPPGHPRTAAAARAEDDGARPEVQPRPADRLSAV